MPFGDYLACCVCRMSAFRPDRYWGHFSTDSVTFYVTNLCREPVTAISESRAVASQLPAARRGGGNAGFHLGRRPQWFTRRYAMPLRRLARKKSGPSRHWHRGLSYRCRSHLHGHLTICMSQSVYRPIRKLDRAVSPGRDPAMEGSAGRAAAVVGFDGLFQQDRALSPRDCCG